MSIKKIALSGGIASGKSYAAQFFLKRSIAVIDLDDINREVLATNQSALVQLFGENAVQNGKTNTAYIRQQVFHKPELLQQLEVFSHPRILQKMQQYIKRMDAEVVIVVVPLLYEKQLFNYFDSAIIISTTYEQQLARLMQRDGISVELAQQMIAAQIDNKTRLQTQAFLPTQVVENTTTLENFNTQLQQIEL